MHILLNILFGLFPACALGWSMAADERKPVDDRVVVSDFDRTKQSTMFLLVSGLWFLTLAMWNWMKSYPLYWIAIWAVAGVVTLGVTYMRSRRTA